MELSRQISEVVARFVAQVSALARELAEQQLTDALDEDAPTASPSSPPARRRRERGSRPRRTPGELERLQQRLLAHVTAHPGQRIEQIKVALAATTRELAVPVHKLLYADLIRTEGERRATRYFAASAPTPAGSR